MRDTLLHPLTSSTPANYVRLLKAYGWDYQRSLLAFYIALVCCLRQPLVWLESARFQKQIDKQAIEPQPVFIIGHWRSGTTHLQNLLCQDPQFGRVTLLQAASPLDFLSQSAVLQKMLRKLLPPTRLMDNVPVSPEAPWEEEMALTSSSPYSFYHVSFFPRHVDRIFRKAVLFEGNDARHTKMWREHYLNFLKKVQFTQPGQRLLLKNPANTARIDQLVRMFPRARFIHIHRNPYEVFVSTVHLYLKAQTAWGLQKPDREMTSRHVLKAYCQLMDAYFLQRQQLKPGQLVEVSMRELESEPLVLLASIYRRLGLDGFSIAEPQFIRYLESQRHYRKNQLKLSERDRIRVQNCWRDSFLKLGYAF